MSKALSLLKATPTAGALADSYLESIKRNLQRDLDNLTARKEKQEDIIFSLSNFSVLADLNAGIKGVTREEAEKRFRDILEAEYNLVLIKEELLTRTELFNKYFGEETTTAPITNS